MDHLPCVMSEGLDPTSTDPDVRYLATHMGPATNAWAAERIKALKAAQAGAVSRVDFAVALAGCRAAEEMLRVLLRRSEPPSPRCPVEHDVVLPAGVRYEVENLLESIQAAIRPYTNGDQ